MTKNEAAALIAMIDTAYPGHFAKIDQQGMDMLVDLWASTCEGYTGIQMAAALKQYMASNTSGFAPVPGQLIQYVVALEDDKDLTEAEAWALVLRASANGIYGAEEEWEKLPPLVQKAIGTSYVLHEMAMQQITSVDESNFKRVYRSVLEREREKRRMPPSTRKALGYEDRLGLPE